MIAKLTMSVTAIRFIYEMIIGIRDLVLLVQEDDVDDGEKHGKEKKELVLGVVETATKTFKKAFDIPLEVDTVMTLADDTVELFVRFYNAIGRFRSLS